MPPRIGVLMGGWGEEREISIKTGEAVVAALSARDHHVTRVFAGTGLDRVLRGSDVEVAFIALHGRMGEDGKVQGMLEVMGIPYTGSGVMASSVAMNKPFAKKLFRFHNLPTPSGYTLSPQEIDRLPQAHGDLGFPCVVKPCRGGSSIGVSVAGDMDELLKALLDACRFGGEALVERRICGREITVGVLGDAVLGSCEIAYPAQTFDFDCKYRGRSKYFLPPRLSATRLANIEALALAAYRALGCRGYGRVDLIASEDHNDQLLEVNTLPGLTRSSLLPKIAAAAGIGFETLAESILASATLDEPTIKDLAIHPDLTDFVREEQPLPSPG